MKAVIYAWYSSNNQREKVLKVDMHLHGLSRVQRNRYYQQVLRIK